MTEQEYQDSIDVMLNAAGVARNRFYVDAFFNENLAVMQASSGTFLKKKEAPEWRPPPEWRRQGKVSEISQHAEVLAFVDSFTHDLTEPWEVSLCPGLINKLGLPSSIRGPKQP